MLLSLFRTLVLMAASQLSAHVSDPCPSSAHMGTTSVAAVGYAPGAAAASPGASSTAVSAVGPQISLSAPAESRRPAILVGMVTRGRFILRADGQRPRVIGPGGAFLESADTPGLRLNSASSNASAQILGLYLPKSLSHHRHADHG